MDKIIVKVGAVTLAAFVGFSGFQVYQTWKSDPFAACRSGAVAGGVIGGKFTLLDEDARTVTDADVIAKPALVYFGYASCPDACPLDNMRNVEAADLLAKQGFDVTPVFISVDPARDTPAVMKSYTDGLGPNLLGLTGSPEQIKVAAEMKIPYLLIVGPRDAETSSVSIRIRGTDKDAGSMPLDKFVAAISAEIADRSAELTVKP